MNLQKRKPMIAGNWKMYNTISEATNLIKAINEGLPSAENIEVVVAPAYLAISKVKESLQNSRIKIAAQDLFWEDQGAFTGMVSGAMLKDAGVDYVIIGHSERRQYFNETDETVNKKIKAAIKHNLLPILCVGETLVEREAGRVNEIVQNQLLRGLAGLSHDEVEKVVIAYEPVWAIGTGKTATPEQAEEVHAFIRNVMQQNFGVDIAMKLRVLYGGSVKASNSKEILSQPNIDGALVGGASLKADEFLAIIKNAE